VTIPASSSRLRGQLFDVLFLGWTILQFVVQSPRLVMPWARRHRIAEGYEGGIDWLERHVLGLTYSVSGELPRQGPALIAIKHQSAWETLKLHLIFDNPAVVVKKELLEIPIWGRYAAALDMIPIDRKSGSTAMAILKQAAGKAMQQKRCLVIFPEGTRVPVGEHRPYKSGVLKLYETTGLPIIPVALNSGLFWPHDGKNKRGGHITLEVLETIPAGLHPATALKLLEERIEEASRRLAGGEKGSAS
jgi:1-acyl-sn-glycerol-3-phosphate acyltransferase